MAKILVASKHPKNLDLYDTLLEQSSHEGAINAAELQLTKRLINTLQGVAILATDDKFDVHYANEYAVEIFKLDRQALGTNKGKLPRNVKTQLKKQITAANKPFSITYQSGSTVRSLQVFPQPKPASKAPQPDYVLHMHDITQRVGVESKLRQTEQLLRNVINTSPDFITVKDEKGRWLLSNNSALSLFKIPKANYQFKTDAQIIPLIDPVFKETFRQLRALNDQAWQSDYNIQKQVVMSMPNGGEKVYDIIKVALYNEDGSRQGILTVGRDITENKLAEHHLKDRSAILDALISADCLLTSDEPWEDVINQVLEQLGTAAHFSQVSLFKNTLQDSAAIKSERLYTWHATDAAPHKRSFKTLNFTNQAFQNWQAPLAQGDVVQGNSKTFTHATANSLKRYGIKALLAVPVFSSSQWWGQIIVEHHHAPSGFSKQEVGALMAIARAFSGAIEKEDTTQRIAQANIAFDSASEGIVITDANAKITAVNQGYTDITGFSEEEVLGTTPQIFNASSHHVWDAINKNGKWRGEIQNLRKSGEEYQELLTLTTVKNKHGEVINYVAVFSDISEIKASQNKLSRLVNHDTLTGLPNRRLLNELLDHAIKRSAREQNQTAILFIDLDRFKAVNDSLGHQVGDQLLIQVSERINQCIRDSDVVARLGGDEFVVMMSLINQNQDAALVAQKIIQTLKREFIINGNEIYIGASIGISISKPEGQDVEALIKEADTAMYHVKNHGKNHYCFYTSALDTHAVEQFNLESHLRHAIADKRFSLLYQPQVSTVDGAIIGAEAFLRWDHPELGTLLPDTFMHLAEETGLIIPIGQWVLKEAAEAMVSWQAQGLDLQSISVNVSTVQILQGNFTDTVYGILVATDCDPSRIALEVTENTMMHNTDFVVDTLNHIKQLGVSLVIDDFGKGFSSLINLKQLPLDKIKIDQSFIQNLPNDLDDAVIANTINGMAKSLGFAVIAEGVENQAQVDFLLNIGCNQAQGYHFGAPLDYEAFTTLLKKQKH